MYGRRVYQTLYRRRDAYGGGGERGAQFGDCISIDTDQVIQVRDTKGNSVSACHLPPCPS